MKKHLLFRIGLPTLVMALLVGCIGGPKVKASRRSNANLKPTDQIAVVPSKIGGEDDLLLPDAIATELMGYGYNVVERTALAQMVKERGFDYTEILNGQEYFKIGASTSVKAVVIVTTRMQGIGVAGATCRVVSTTDGSILMSVSYSQPAPDHSGYARHDSVIDTAQKIAIELSELAELP